VLPHRLFPYELVLTPLFGLAMLAMVGYYGSNNGLTMRQLVPVALAIALFFSTLALVKEYRGERRWLPGMPPLPELLPLLLIMAAIWLLNIAPLLSYGTLMPIGDNWDVEFYLPLADYLKDYSYHTLAQAPANPLRDLLLTERLVSRAMGATYAQSMADVLLFRDAWDSFVPMLALLRALTLGGLYALLRGGFGIGRMGALFGVALAGVNSLLLWTTYNSFGMGLGGLALLPALLLCTLYALEQPISKTTFHAPIAAMLLLAGLTCTYWPLLMAYGAGGLGIGLALLWEHRKAGQWWGVVWRGGLVLLGGVVLVLPVHINAKAAFVGMFLAKTPSMGIEQFLSPMVIIGSAPFSHEWQDITVLTQTHLARGGLVAAAALLLAAVWQGVPRRVMAITVVLSVTAYLLGLRYIVDYPYGLLRGTSYVNTLLLGIIGAGAFWHWQPRPFPLPRMLTDVARYILALLLLAASLQAADKTYAVYEDQPGVYSRDMASMRAAVANLPEPTAPVMFSSAPELRGPYSGAWAYMLRQHELQGIIATGYRPMVNIPRGDVPGYVVLRDGGDPRAYGVSPNNLLWHEGQSALYAVPPNREWWVSGRESFYTEGALLQDNTTYTRAQMGVGNHSQAGPDTPLALDVGRADTGDSDGASITLALASFVPQQAELTLAGERRILALPAGASLYETGSLTTTTPVSMTLRGLDAPVMLRWVSSAIPTPPPITPTITYTPTLLDDTLLVGIASQPYGITATTRLQVANPGQHAVRFAVQVYEEVPGYAIVPLHYAWTVFAAPPNGTSDLHLDLLTPAFSLNGTPLPMQTGELRDGQFFVSLWVYQGEQVRRVLPFMRFERREGTITNMVPLDLNSEFAWLPPPTEPLSVTFTGGIALRGKELSLPQGQPQAKAGEQVTVSLLWYATQAPSAQPYMVFVQMLDEQDRKVAEWNGAAGGDWHPTTAWQVGERIWQDVPLDIAADTPAGRYRVIAGLFDPTTGERLPMPDGADMLTLGEVMVVVGEL
jgi:hypothetical protein